MRKEDQPSSRSAAVFCRVSQDRLLLLCGDSGEPGHRLCDVWQLQIHNNWFADCQHVKWRQLHPAGAASALAPRSNAAAAAVMGRYVVVFGGWECSGLTPLTALAVLDLSVCAWLDNPGACQAHQQPAARGQPSLAALTDGTALLLFAGWDGARQYNDLWRLDADSWQWQLLQPEGQPPEERADHTGVMWRYCDCGHWKDILVIFGGSCAAGLLNDVCLFDVDTARWSRAHCGGVPPEPRSSHAAIILGDCMIVSGGRLADAVVNDVHILDLSTLTWRQLPPQNPPLPPLCRHVMGTLGDVARPGPPDTATTIGDKPLHQAALEHDDTPRDAVQNDEAGRGSDPDEGKAAIGKLEDGSEAVESSTGQCSVWVFGGFDGVSTRGELWQVELPDDVPGLHEATTASTDGKDAVTKAPLQISDLEDADAVLAMPAWKQIRRLHTTAMAAKMDQYIDPLSGYTCWTAHYLKRRPCCGNACRHCPYGHKNVVKG